MARNRYLIQEPDQTHFLTCTVMEWLPIFSRPDAAAIVLDSWRYLRERRGLQLYGYVVMENHVHFVGRSDDLDACLTSFKSYTAKMIIRLLQAQGAHSLLDRLTVSMLAHKSDREHQFWQEGTHAELILDEAMLRQKLEYLQSNPVRRGYVDKPEHWRYSSARCYGGEPGLVEIDPWW